MKKRPVIKPNAERGQPSRKDILTAQAGALTTQLGTLRFNFLQQEAQFTTQIANIMREIGVLDAAAPKKDG